MRILLSLWSFVGATAFAGEISTHTMTVKLEEKSYRIDYYAPVADGKTHPGLILVPDYWGKDELDRVQAERLARGGFIVSVVDIYGDNKNSKESKVADAYQAEAEESNLSNLLNLLSLVVDQLKQEKNLNPHAIGAVGFGYGGGLAWNLLKGGQVKDLKAVVSFYGGTRNLTPTKPSAGLKTAFLYLRPEHDVYTTKKEMEDFEQELKHGKYDFRIERFPEAQHAFIHRTIANYGHDLGNSFMYYDEPAANKAWAIAIKFLNEKLK